MKPDSGFLFVDAGLRHGDEAAAAEVFERFTGRLIGLARSRLDQRLQGKVEPEDVLQSVYRSFFMRQREGKFHLDGWDNLWSLLAQITVRKCYRQIERFKTTTRNIDRESAAPPPDGDPKSVSNLAVARDPTPLEAVTLTELVEQLMCGLNDRERQIVTSRLQGYNAAEIGSQVGRTERTVERVLAQVRKRAEILLRQESETE